MRGIRGGDGDDVDVCCELTICAAGILAMRYAGPLIAAGQEGGYRPLRGTAPWKYIGFALGGGGMVAALVTLVEGRLRWTALATAAFAVIAIILLYDMPFEDLLLPPNGDV